MIELIRRAPYRLLRTEEHRRLLLTRNGKQMPVSVFPPEFEGQIAARGRNAVWHLKIVAAYRPVACRPWYALPVEPLAPRHFFITREQSGP